MSTATEIRASEDEFKIVDVTKNAIIPGHSLPAYYYTSNERYLEDIRIMREKLWLVAGHESQIPKTGDYKLFEFDNESIIIIRDKSGSINAFFNVCRHRGAKICSEQQGNARLLVCPYHAWSFRTDGTLLPPRSMPEDFDPKQYGLKPCHVRSLEGILFVSLARGTPPDFDEFAAPFKTFLEAYSLKSTKAIREDSLVSRANWKIVQENMMECYHCPSVHKDLVRVTAGEMGENEYVDANNETASSRLHRLGRSIPPFEDEPDLPHLRSAMQIPMGNNHVSATMDGRPAAKLLGNMKEYSGAWTLVTFNPQAHAVLYDDVCQILAYTPLGVTKSHSTMIWLIREDCVEGSDYDPEHVFELLFKTMQEDIDITNRIQLGVESSAYEPGPHSYEESRVSDYDTWYAANFVGK